MPKLSRRSFVGLSAALPWLAIPGDALAAAKTHLVYVGPYTGQTSKGIYAYHFDDATAKLDTIGLVAEIGSPSFLAIHPSQRFLYAVSEGAQGSVAAYTIDRPSGKLTHLNTVSAKGGGPCHVAVDKTGHTVAVANYNTGSIAAFPVSADGSLGEATAFDQHHGSSANPQRQKGPHAHCVVFSPDNRFLMSCDLGLDKILIYRFDPEKSTLVANDPPFGTVKPGSGPRHFAFHPSARFAYAINEIASTVTVFSYDATRGALTEIQDISTLPEGNFPDNSTAEIEVHPSGKFLYGSNRGHNSIAVFAIDPKKGTLTLIQNASTQGGPPRNFKLGPNAKYLLAGNQDTDTIVTFRVDAHTGKLTPTGSKVEIDAPVCIQFVNL